MQHLDYNLELKEVAIYDGRHYLYLENLTALHDGKEVSWPKQNSLY